MKSKHIIVLIFALAIMVSCGKQIEKNLPNPKATALQTKDSLTYNLEVKLEILKKDIWDNGFVKKLPGYFISISIKNLDKDTFPISYLSCSFDETFIYEPFTKKPFVVCDRNTLEGGFLLQNQRIIFQTTIIDPRYFWYLQNSEKIRVGFYLKRIKVGDRFLRTLSKTNQVYWSNEVNLKTTLPSYHFYDESISYLDSLDNNIENYFGYPISAEY
jgi:hypothetical protein